MWAGTGILNVVVCRYSFVSFVFQITRGLYFIFHGFLFIFCIRNIFDSRALCIEDLQNEAGMFQT